MDLYELSVEELLELIDDAKAVIKAKKENIDETNRGILKEVNEGRRILILFKGEPTVAKYVGLTEKRFSVEIEGKRKSILLDKLLSAEPQVD